MLPFTWITTPLEYSKISIIYWLLQLFWVEFVTVDVVVWLNFYPLKCYTIKFANEFKSIFLIMFVNSCLREILINESVVKHEIIRLHFFFFFNSFTEKMWECISINYYTLPIEWALYGKWKGQGESRKSENILRSSGPSEKAKPFREIQVKRTFRWDKFLGVKTTKYKKKGGLVRLLLDRKKAYILGFGFIQILNIFKNPDNGFVCLFLMGEGGEREREREGTFKFFIFQRISCRKDRDFFFFFYG